ncbi:MAG: cytochrome c-type biogenesis protein CcmH [Sphingomonadaceae bacterium]
MLTTRRALPHRGESHSPALRLILVALLSAGVVVLWLTAPLGATDPADELIDELRCPSAASSRPLRTSNTPEAAWMRSFIRAKTAEGWPRQRIVDTLVRQYGERILPAPSKQGFSLAAWITPFATIFGGAALLGYLLTAWLRERRWHDAYLNAEVARDLSEEELRRYESQLSRDLQQFE